MIYHLKYINIGLFAAKVFPRSVTQEHTTLIFPLSELDQAYKDKKHYPIGFQVHVRMSMGPSVSSENVNTDQSEDGVLSSSDDGSYDGEDDGDIEH